MRSAPDSLVLTPMPAIRANMARVADDRRTMRSEMVAAAIKARLDRIERRLDLVG